jgi:hypothetical protein
MLPLGTEPLVLADGTTINPIDGTVVEEEVLVEVPTAIDAQREVVSARLRISDLPVPPEQMNTLSVILSYSLQGVENADIATLLHIDEDWVTDIKQSDGYKELQTTIIKNIIDSDLSDVRNLFVQHSRGAAGVMLGLLDSKSESTRGSAAKDILDRAGHRPVDVIDHRHTLEGGLVIQYVKPSKEVPTIDITPEKEF